MGTTKTTNLNLTKPDKDEQYNVKHFNDNMDLIDSFAGQVPARALTADKLTTGANINGVRFDGTTDVTLPPTGADTDLSNLTTVGQQTLLNLIYPVGSLYMSVNAVNPATLFGFGTWTQIKDTFLLAAGDTYANAATGGSAEVSLSTSQLPAHNHTASTDSTGAHTHSRGTQEISGQSYNGYRCILTYGDGALQIQGSSRDWGSQGSVTGGNGFNFYASRNWSGATSSNGAHTHTVTVNNAGQGEAHDNMPPYLAVNIWKRVA